MTIRKYDQYQYHFEVVNPVNNIPDNHPCFIIDSVVESLDFDEFNSNYIDSVGMPIYDRELLLKIDLMGIIDGILSSRRICERLNYDDVYKFLAGGHKPNFRTLCISRHENAEKFEEALLKINIIGRSMGIVTLTHISTDGSYFKGNASVNKLFTKKDMEIIDELIQQRYDIDREENLLYGDKNHVIVEEDFYNTIQDLINGDIVENTIELIKKDKDNMEVEKKVVKTVEKEIEKPKLKRISKKNKDIAIKAISGDEDALKKIKAVKKKLGEKWQDKVNMTDPDTFAGKNKKGVFQSLYNIIFSVDSDSKFILANNMSDSYVDTNQLVPMLKKLKNIGLIKSDSKVSADCIFNTIEALEYMENESIDGLVPEKYDSSIIKNQDYEAENEFHKHNFDYTLENDCFICPEGNILPFKNQYKDGRRVYYTNECKNCCVKDKCAKNQNVRVITAYKGDYYKQRMKSKMQSPKYQEEYKKRSSTAESPLGDIKHNNKLDEFTVRGTAKVYVESIKFSISHNVRTLAKAISEKGLNVRKIMKEIIKDLKNIDFLNNFHKIFIQINIVIIYN